MVEKNAIDQLPGLPHVLIEILDAISSDNADYKGIANIVRCDTAVVAKLISAANSSIFGNSKPCDSIERALLFLGTGAVKTIVITTSIQQFFDDFSLQHDQFLKSFWRRSLITANVAKVLATLTAYPNPDEAYLCGLLANVGQLILLHSHGDKYLAVLAASDSDEQLLQREMEQFETHHCTLSAALIESWAIPGFMADAVRYQREPVATILDAHHLVKIINLSSHLSSQPTINEQTLAAADTLFGFNEALTAELLSRIANDTDNMAQALGIDTGVAPVRAALGKRLANIAEMANISAELWQASNQESLQNAINRVLFLTFGITKNMLFLYDTQQNLLTAQADKNPQAVSQTFSVPGVAGRSLISDSLLARQSASSQDYPTLNIIDRQLLRYLDASHLICWPLVSDDTAIGVLVLGVDPHQQRSLDQKSSLAASLTMEIAQVIASSTRRVSELALQGDSSADYREKIGEAVHEASNPLSIIRNYLELLSVTLGENHSAEGEITIIKEEIDRVGNILLRLNEPTSELQTAGAIAINTLVESISHIVSSSLCVAKNIVLKVNLDPAVADIEGNSEHLKQVVTNLLKNAVEALPIEGQINVSTEASVSFGGKQFVGIYIEDNGPGIAENIKTKLFSPVDSSKGGGHSGLGLSIVKRLIDEMGGSIVCRSNPRTGTQFQILLPEPR